MASAIVFPAVHYPAAVPFCDKSDKEYSVVTDSLSKRCTALFYKVISWICSLFSTKLAHRYKCLSEFERYKIHDGAFKRFGAEIIDFSTNSFKRVKESLSAKVNELDSLKNIYGADKINHLCQLWPEVDLTGKLSRQDMITHGCCFGMSLDFVSSYLLQIKTGKTSLEAVKTIAPHFVNGASDNAELSQIFFEAIIDQEFSKRVLAAQEENGKWLEAQKAEVLLLPREEIPQRLALVKAQVVEKIEEFREQIVNEFVHEIIPKNFERIAAPFHLTMEQPLLKGINLDADSNRNIAQVEAIVNDLPAGAYEVSLKFSEDGSLGAHSIAFIKTDEGQDFIFDPNHASIAVGKDQSAARLWDVVSKYPDKDFKLEIVPLALNE